MILLQKKSKSVFLLRVSLLGLMYSLAFLKADTFGWLIIPWFLSMLFFCFFVSWSWAAYGMSGFVWGLVANAGNFVWLWWLLWHKSAGGAGLCILLYVGVVIYAAVTAACWFISMGLATKKITETVGRIWGTVIAGVGCTAAYFYLLDRGMFWFLGHGYPFANPLIPLMSYKWIISFLWLFCGERLEYFPVTYASQTLAVAVTGNGAANAFVALEPSRGGRAEEVAAVLGQLNLNLLAKKFSSVCVVGPETTVAFALNRYPYVVADWTASVPSNVHVLVGAFREEGAVAYQTAYWLRKGLIIKNYDKISRVALAEGLPAFMQHWKWAEQLFLSGKEPIVGGAGGGSFALSSNMVVVPIICSDFFFRPRYDLWALAGNEGIVVAMINDSWFPEFFKKIMIRTAQLRACLLGRQVLYVRHAKDLSILPFFATV